MKRRLQLTPAVLALAVVVAITSPSFASTDSELAVAENDYAALDYQGALAAAESVLGQTGTSHDALTRATRVAALSSSALGKTEAARQYFTQMLEYDPTFKIDTRLSPRFSEPFAEAQGYWSAQARKPGVEVSLALTAGQAGRLRYGTADPLNLVTKVAVGYRWAPARAYTVSVGEPGEQEIETRANPKGSTRFEYYVRALDAKDRSIFEQGSAEAPKFQNVDAAPVGAVVQEKKSFFASPVFWTVAGVVVAGAAVGVFFAARPTEYRASSQAHTSIGANCGTASCN